MKKLIVKHKVILIAAIAALLFVFFCIPFITINPPPGSVNPCDAVNSDQFPALCSLVAPESLFSYLQDKEPIDSIDWQIPILGLFISFIVFYGEINLFKYVLLYRNNKKKKIWYFVLKLVLAAVILLIQFYLVCLILSFFGLEIFGF